MLCCVAEVAPCCCCCLLTARINQQKQQPNILIPYQFACAISIHSPCPLQSTGIIILSAVANKFRLNKLSRVDQFVMSYGGLRGAVAFALALLIKEKRVESQPMFVTTTIAVIYFTVFVQGITIKPLVRILNVKRANKKKPTMNERIHERVS